MDDGTRLNEINGTRHGTTRRFVFRVAATAVCGRARKIMGENAQQIETSVRRFGPNKTLVGRVRENGVKTVCERLLSERRPKTMKNNNNFNKKIITVRPRSLHGRR